VRQGITSGLLSSLSYGQVAIFSTFRVPADTGRPATLVVLPVMKNLQT